MSGADGSLAVGSVVADRYEVVSRLGSGGMGEVYKVRDRELRGELVALKVLHATLSRDTVAFDRFRNEVLVARTLSHPNIVRIHDIARAAEGFYFLTMEYVEGESLASRINTLHSARGARPLDDGEIVGLIELLAQLLLAIGFAHNRGIIHRDIKPQNVLIAPDGTVKLADFGTARLLVAGADLTPTGQVVGTPFYMSPEQIRGEELDARSDIYAVGIVAFEMFAGRRPFEGDNVVSIVFKHLQDELPKLLEERTGAPEWIDGILRRATAKDRSQRFGSADEMREALLAGTAASTLASVPIGGTVEAKRDPSWLLGATLTVVLLIVAGLLGKRLFFPDERGEHAYVTVKETSPTVVATAVPAPQAVATAVAVEQSSATSQPTAVAATSPRPDSTPDTPSAAETPHASAPANAVPLPSLPAPPDTEAREIGAPTAMEEAIRESTIIPTAPPREEPPATREAVSPGEPTLPELPPPVKQSPSEVAIFFRDPGSSVPVDVLRSAGAPVRWIAVVSGESRRSVGARADLCVRQGADERCERGGIIAETATEIRFGGSIRPESLDGFRGEALAVIRAGTSQLGQRSITIE